MITIATLGTRTLRATLRSLPLALALIVGPPPACAALPPAADNRWIEVRSARFSVYSNVGELTATHVARHLERLAETMKRTMRGLRVDGGREVRVYVFRDPKSFKPYCPFPEDEAGVTAGFHVSGRDAEYITFYASPGEFPLGLAAHEYTHAVMSRSLGDLPIWINEGLAEYFSTFQPLHRGADIGLAIPGHLAWLRHNMFPLNELLLIGGNSPDYERGERRETIYAQSWALTHVLMMDRVEPDRFGPLLSELTRGFPSADVLQQIYGPNALDSLQDQVRKEAKLAVFPYIHWDFADDFNAVPVKTRVLDRVETRTVLGELLAHTRENLYPSAREHLGAAWAEDPKRVLPAALLGELAERQGDQAGASKWFAAVERSSRAEPRALAIAGMALAQRRLESREPFAVPAPGAGPDALRARAMLAKALEGEPNESDWLAQFGMTFLDDTVGVNEGIGALLQAQEDWPRRADIVGALAVLSVRAGKRGAALATYGRIPPGSEQHLWRYRVGYLILEQTQVEAEQLVRDDRAAEAESLVVKLRRDVNETGVAAACDKLLAWIRATHPGAAKSEH